MHQEHNSQVSLYVTFFLLDIKPEMLPLLFKDCESIAHEPESVPAVVLEVEVLGPEALQNFLVVNDAPCIHGGYLAVYLVVLVPGSAATCPDGSLQELVGVGVVVSRCISIDCDRPI